ncbi:MAG TPA: hypothetical protein DIT97_08220 [Gimesia maris]|uniref:Uncharacterized protein n=1 Tax=Gimesia maris TaxID=122 RepID=A0A3D3R5X8_9PLAN|nr:hypothetical protein [Gimesia maris]
MSRSTILVRDALEKLKKFWTQTNSLKPIHNAKIKFAEWGKLFRKQSLGKGLSNFEVTTLLR